MKYFLILTLVFGSSEVFAADYTYCKQYLESKVLNRRDFNLKIDPSTGTVSLNKDALGYKYENINGEHRYTDNSKWRHSFFTKDNKIQKVVRLKEFSNTPDDWFERQTVTFEVKNGICYPSEMREEEKAPYAHNFNQPNLPKKWTYQNALIWNTGMCREITEFVKKNPSIAKCKCGDETATKALEKIIKKYDPNMKTPEAATDANAVQNAYLALNPILGQASSIINSCSKITGVTEAINDEKIWKEQGGGVMLEPPGLPNSGNRAN